MIPPKSSRFNFNFTCLPALRLMRRPLLLQCAIWINVSILFPSVLPQTFRENLTDLLYHIRLTRYLLAISSPRHSYPVTKHAKRRPACYPTRQLWTKYLPEPSLHSGTRPHWPRPVSSDLHPSVSAIRCPSIAGRITSHHAPRSHASKAPLPHGVDARSRFSQAYNLAELPQPRTHDHELCLLCYRLRLRI